MVIVPTEAAPSITIQNHQQIMGHEWLFSIKEKESVRLIERLRNGGFSNNVFLKLIIFFYPYGARYGTSGLGSVW